MDLRQMYDTQDRPVGRRDVLGRTRPAIVRCRRCIELITVPSAVLNAANKLVVPCRT
jgi:hypothetical protein